MPHVHASTISADLACGSSSPLLLCRARRRRDTSPIAWACFPTPATTREPPGLDFSWYAIRIARRPADARRTFGYHRVGVLAALMNAVSLVVIALLIFWEAVQRLRFPEPVEGGLMIGVALVAVALNGLISLWLREEAQHDLNIRRRAHGWRCRFRFGCRGCRGSRCLDGQTIADPLVSLLIGVLILWSSWDILTEAVDVLLEAVPRGLDMARLVEAIRRVPGVQDVHDLHAWTISSGRAACSCHILVGEQGARESQQVQRAVAEVLEHDFRITHSTIQVEVECCEGTTSTVPFARLRKPTTITGTDKDIGSSASGSPHPPANRAISGAMFGQ